MINFKISEFIKSNVSKKYNLNNMPNVDSLDNILNLICNCLQPIRNLFNKPVIITSGYRSDKLNKLVGGSLNSQHLTGCAADFIIKGISVSNIIKLISNSNIEFDQLINEYDKWVHVSYVVNNNRKQILYKK